MTRRKPCTLSLKVPAVRGICSFLGNTAGDRNFALVASVNKEIYYGCNDYLFITRLCYQLFS